MKNLEATEVRGISIKQLVTYVIAVVAFIGGLVYRDVKREQEMVSYQLKIDTMQKQIEAAEKDRAAIKIFDNNQNERLMKIETKLDFMIDLKK